MDPDPAVPGAPLNGDGAPDPVEWLARVGVLIVNYNAGRWLKRAIDTLRPEGAVWPQVVVVDNGSRDGSLEALDASENRPGITIDRAGANLGFAAGINRAAEHCDRELLLLLNPDCLIPPDHLARLVIELDAHPEAALVSGRIVDERGNEQRASRRRLPTPARVLRETLPFATGGVDLTRTPAPENPVEAEAVSGACMLVRAEVFRKLGGLDQRYPMHFEDLDLFARLGEAGWTIRWLPDVEIVHAGGASSRRRPARVLIAKHRGLWRYLARHCSDRWPRWQRPLWALLLGLHLAVRLPLAWLGGPRRDPEPGSDGP